MTPTTARWLIGVQTAAIIALFWMVAYLGQDEFKLGAAHDSEAIEAVSRVATGPAMPVVQLGEAARAAAGIVVEPLAAHSLSRQQQFTGAVADIQPLIDLRSRYQMAVGELAQARAATARSDAEWRRAQALFADDRNVSERALETANAQAKSDQAKLASAETTASGLHALLLQGWGARLAEWASAERSADFERLAQQQDSLLLVTLRQGQMPGKGAAPTLHVSVIGATAGARPAEFVSAAPRSDPQLPGETFFYVVRDANLRAGTRLSVQTRGDKAGRQGVVVPAAAVVWHGGKPWVYIQEDDDQFVRHALSVADPVDRDWFDAGLEPDARVVTSGAQLLLSEELRYRIKNENED